MYDCMSRQTTKLRGFDGRDRICQKYKLRWCNQYIGIKKN